MNRLLISCFATILSCTSASVQKSQDMQEKAEILISESQGGAENSGFKIIKNEQEFQQTIKSKLGNYIIEPGSDPTFKYPAFPADKKVVLYDLGRFNSGDHSIREIKGVSVKNNILYVEVPAYESGGMEIQVLSNPWFIFTVPSDYKFTSVQLKASK